MKRKAVFLDRDGVINRDINDYTYKVEDFELLPGVVDAIKHWNHNGYWVIVITNQGGISKKLYDHHDVKLVHEHMLGLIHSQGGEIQEIYYCPHHDRIENCLCRKPGSLLIEKALARFDIDPSKSYMIGDRDRDVKAAEDAGVTGLKCEVNSNLMNMIPKIS